MTRSIPGARTAVRRLAAVLFIFSTCFLLPGFCPEMCSASDAAPDMPVIQCDVNKGECVFEQDGKKIALDIAPKPVTAMTDLVFTVRFSGYGMPEKPFIDLGMPGMKMGPNRVMLTPGENGVYTGKGVIVRCPSGRRTWKADVTIPGRGGAEFVFDVVY